MEARKIPYVFLTSHAFSGSTLTSFLLGSHPEIATVGMLTGPANHLDLKTYRCSCGQLFQQDPFWQAVTEKVNAYGLSYSLDEHMGTRIELGGNTLMRRIRTDSLRYNALEKVRDSLMFNLWPGHKREMHELVRRNELFAQAILEVSGKPIFLDTSKDPMRMRYLRLSPAIDLYVIHLIRDVRGVVASIMKRRSDMNVEQATKHWLVAEHNIRRHLATVPASRQIEVKYEDITSNTLETMNRLFSFMGARELEKMDDFREVDNHILGNKMRKQGTSEIKTDERWRTALSEKQLQIIDGLTQPKIRAWLKIA